MYSYRTTPEYATAFRTFLRHTNEKLLLFNAIKRRILESGGRSLLDIGAGNGDLAIPLSELVGAYVAVEPNIRFADTLESKNMMVINKAFPCLVPYKFDIVLASHVVPFDGTDSRIFLEAARQCLNPEGTFIMVTYDEEAASDWGRLISQSGLPTDTSGRDRFTAYRNILLGWGALQTEGITAYVEAEHMTDMMLALAFVYSDGQPEKTQAFLRNDDIRKILATRYRKPGCYRFPFTHYVLEVKVR